MAAIAIINCAVYMLSGNEGFFTAFGLVNLVMRLLGAMYIGVSSFLCDPITSDTSVLYLLQSVCYLLLPSISIGVCHIGYHFEKNNIKIFGKIK